MNEAVCDGVFGSADGDLPVFEWLSQHLQGVFVELRELIAEEHAVVCQTDLSRHGVVATADQCHLRDGVVRCAERPLGDEG